MPVKKHYKDGKLVKLNKDTINTPSWRGNKRRETRGKHIETVKEQQRLGMESLKRQTRRRARGH